MKNDQPESRRVHGNSLLSELPQDRQMRELVEWIRNRGGIVTAREVQQGRRNIKTAEHAELELQNLVDAGYGEWIDSEPGTPGRPTRRFKLRDPVYVYETPTNPSKNGNTVDVDSVDNPKTKRIVI